MQVNRSRDLFFDSAMVTLKEQFQDGKEITHIVPIRSLPELSKLLLRLQTIRILNDEYERLSRHENIQ